VPGGTLVNGPYCDPSVDTCPGQAPVSTPDPNSLFQPGPATDTSGGSSTDTSGNGSNGAGSSTDTSGGSGTGSTDTSGNGTSTDTSSSSTDSAQAPDTGSSPSPAPAGAGGASSSGGKGNSLFGNSPLPAADTPATAATETSLNIWAIVGAGLIVLVVVVSHVISTLRQRGRKRAAQTA
jgi:hypothetical protein